MDSRSVFGFADCVAVCIATAVTSQGSFRKSKLAMADNGNGQGFMAAFQRGAGALATLRIPTTPRWRRWPLTMKGCLSATSARPLSRPTINFEGIKKARTRTTKLIIRLSLP